MIRFSLMVFFAGILATWPCHAQKKRNPKRKPAAAKVEPPENTLLNIFEFELVPQQENQELGVSVGGITRAEQIQKLSGGLFHSDRWLLQIPLVTTKPMEVIANEQRISPSENTTASGSKSYLIPILVSRPRQCVEVEVTNNQTSTQYYELCASVPKASLVMIGGLGGPFHFRRSLSYWLQGGFSFLNQQLGNSFDTSLSNTTSQGAVRVLGGINWKMFQAQVQVRQTVVNFGDIEFIPQWIDFKMGYGWELPMFWGISPHLSILGGADYYRNLVSQNADTDSLYISSYLSPSLGFRSRFALTARTELGGELHYTFFGFDIGKIFIQGDFRYWLTPRFSLGVGYWVDRATVEETDQLYREFSYALETYVRIAF